MAGLLIVNCAQLITMQPLAKDRRFTHIKDADLGRINNAWLAVEAGKVLDFGENPIPEKYHTWPQLDAKGSLVTPGLIDCHSHPIFGGDRTDEFRQKLAGASYQDIAARGGGIKSTIKATRAATSETLLQNTQQILKIFLSHGVTSLEAKTGYGQSPAEELRLLRILKQVANTEPQTIAVTCLALHDIPSECSDKQSFIQGMQDELLPVLVKEQLADWVDAFIEDGYFSVSEAEAFIQKALDLGLKIRIHADEFKDSGAAAAAARWGAISADHLQKASREGLSAMAKAGTVAVLLPGTSFYSKIAYANAELFRNANCALAVATDFNPGSCPMSNLPFAASLAALYCGLSMAEALVAVTWNAARALSLEHIKGSLARGFDADIVIHGVKTLEQWIADFGQTRPKLVLIAGKETGIERPV